ncbi:hypothetical protein NKJ72_22085 [Mesorhizobium sp. M0045]|uniref:hypothetical protein n=1 Tax=Mesorhizobium sp. M0045 TaxID=2956857 RepID=UPI003338BCE5
MLERLPAGFVSKLLRLMKGRMSGFGSDAHPQRRRNAAQDQLTSRATGGVSKQGATLGNSGNRMREGLELEKAGGGADKHHGGG